MNLQSSVNRWCWFALLVSVLVFAGCVSPPKPYDYTNFRAHPPRSILILPPMNDSTAVEGTYGYLSTATMPVAEMGYYVFPVAVADLYFKENGLPAAAEMHQAPLDKIREVIGADAVLYVTLKQYGSQYVVVSSTTTVTVQAKLVDTRTGTLLWEGQSTAQQGSGGSGNIIGDLVAALVSQAVNTSTDAAHGVSQIANVNLVGTKDHGLLYGPYSPKFGSEQAKAK